MKSNADFDQYTQLDNDSSKMGKKHNILNGYSVINSNHTDDEENWTWQGSRPIDENSEYESNSPISDDTEENFEKTMMEMMYWTKN